MGLRLLHLYHPVLHTMNDRGKVDAEYFEDVHAIHFCDLLTLGSLVQTEMMDHRYYYA